MNPSKVSSIKRSQKESLILKEFSKLFLEITLDNSDLRGLIVTKAILSSDKSTCNILFFDPEGEESFNSKLEILKLYKPSIRTALAKIIPSRYVPELRFSYNKQFVKEKRINELLDKIKSDSSKSE